MTSTNASPYRSGVVRGSSPDFGLANGLNSAFSNAPASASIRPLNTTDPSLRLSMWSSRFGSTSSRSFGSFPS
jgi:hypothetical protein